VENIRHFEKAIYTNKDKFPYLPQPPSTGAKTPFSGTFQALASDNVKIHLLLSVLRSYKINAFFPPLLMH